MIKYVSVGKKLNVIEAIPNIDNIIAMLKCGIKSANSHWAEANGAAEDIRSILKTIKPDERAIMNNFFNYFGLTILGDNRFHKTNPNKSSIKNLSDDVKCFIGMIDESESAKKYLYNIYSGVSFHLRCESLIHIIGEISILTNEMQYDYT